MSVKVDRFNEKLRDRLDTIEARLKSVRTNIQSKSHEAEKNLRDKLDAARSKVRAEKKRIQKIRATRKAEVQQEIAEDIEVINGWKEKREIGKLNARADRAQTDAADAIDQAAASIDEAEEAILYAAVARLDADTVQ
jgi:hypothetical protein